MTTLSTATVATTIALGLISAQTSKAQTGRVEDLQILKGACGAASNIAEGPETADISKTSSRFLCDSAVIAFYDRHNGHVMITFANSKAHHAPQLGFAGYMDRSGIILTVDRVYFEPGVATAVNDSECKFFFKRPHLEGIVCGVRVVEDRRATAAVVNFIAAPGQ